MIIDLLLELYNFGISIIKSKFYKIKLSMKRNILLTGASSGIGLKAAEYLLRRGNSLILPCRNNSRAKETFDNLNSLIDDIDLSKFLKVEVADLEDLRSLDIFLNKLISKSTRIDTLILNAGLQYTGSSTPRFSKQNFELTFAVNQLANQYIVSKIFKLLTLSSSPRIIITASAVHDPNAPGGQFGKAAGLDKLKGLSSGQYTSMLDGNPIFNADKAYKDSKLCNILFARHLAKLIKERNLNIPVIAWAPGLVIPRTDQGFFRYSRKYNELTQRVFAFLVRDIFRITESVERAGGLLCDLAINIQYQSKDFIYLSNILKSPGIHEFKETIPSPEAMDDDLGEYLWRRSSELLEINNELEN